MPDQTPEVTSVPEIPAQNDNLPDVADLPPEDFFHWYNLTFTWGSPNGGTNTANIYIGYDEMKVTAARIEVAGTRCAPNADPRTIVLVAASYLGFMTKSEMDA